MAGGLNPTRAFIQTGPVMAFSDHAIQVGTVPRHATCKNTYANPHGGSTGSECSRQTDLIH